MSGCLIEAIWYIFVYESRDQSLMSSQSAVRISEPCDTLAGGVLVTAW